MPTAGQPVLPEPGPDINVPEPAVPGPDLPGWKEPENPLEPDGPLPGGPPDPRVPQVTSPT